MSMGSATRSRGTIRGVHVFWVIAGFFAVTIAVNAFFIVNAVGSFPGEDVRNSYVQGNDYNATLERRVEQERLGWSSQAGLEGAGEDAKLVFRLTDAEGRPVGGRAVEARFRIIGRSREEAVLRLPEAEPGVYANIFLMPGPGRVALKLVVAGDEGAEPVFLAEKVLVLP